MVLTAMGNLLFWLGLGAAQRGAGSRTLERRHWVASLIAGVLLAPFDSRRNVSSVGQPTMNWRRGLFRLWIVGSALFVLAVAFICYSEIKSHAEVPWAKLEMCATIAFGVPLVVLILGWAFLGSAAERS